MIKLFLVLMIQTIIAGTQIQTSSNAKNIFFIMTFPEEILMVKKVYLHNSINESMVYNYEIFGELSDVAKEKTTLSLHKKELLKSDKNPFYLIILLILLFFLLLVLCLKIFLTRSEED